MNALPGEPPSEAAVLAKWRHLYAELRRARKGRPTHRLQHAPLSPYRFTIEDIQSHLIKDSYVKYLYLCGMDVVSVPHWDLHAPGTEQPTDVAEDSSMARESYEQQVYSQTAEQLQCLSDLGIFADWEAGQRVSFARQDGKLLNLVRQFQETGYMTRREAPGHWCIQCQTVLSSDELDFQVDEVPSALVLFPVHTGLEAYGSPLYLLAYLHEPWMLAGTSAITVNNTGSYAVISMDGRMLITSMDSLDKISLEPAIPATAEYEIIGELPPNALGACTCMLPTQNVEIQVLLVEEQQPWAAMARTPAHSFQDNLFAQRYPSPLRSVVDDQGYFTEDANQFCGMDVTEADKVVLFALESNDYLLHHTSVQSMRPHCWVCGSRVFFRVAMQWLLQPDGSNSPRRLANTLTNVIWQSQRAEDIIQSLYANSNDWSISRKRSWGIPFPVLYCDGCGDPLSMAKLGKNIRDFISRRGLQEWVSLDVDTLVPQDVSCSQCGSHSFYTETSVLRSDFSSAIHQLFHQANEARSSNVTSYFAEPLRRHGQWFATWLLTAVAYQGTYPSKHLHVADTACEQGCIHLEEPTNREHLQEQPRDEARLWAVCHESWPYIRAVYGRLVEVTARLLQAADNVEPDTHEADPLGIHLLLGFHMVQGEVQHAYQRLDFSSGLQKLFDFCEQDLLDFYLPLVAPILEDADAPYHRSVRCTLRKVLARLVYLLAPVTPVLAEQLWALLGNQESIFRQTWPGFASPDEQTADTQALMDTSRWEVIRQLHAELFEHLLDVQASSFRIFVGELRSSLTLQAYSRTLAASLRLDALDFVESVDELSNAQPLLAVPGGWIEIQGD